MTFSCRCLVTGLVFIACVARIAHAQAEAGVVADETTHTPLVRVRVALFTQTNARWHYVDSTLTDGRGLFQIALPSPGVYQLHFGRSPGLSTGPVDTVAQDSMIQHEYAVPLTRLASLRAFAESEVDEPATAVEHRTPKYPETLRNTGFNGTVQLRFVIGTNGRVELSTINVLRATDPAFVQSVRDFLATAYYRPARIGGVRVPQVADQEFNFAMAL